MINIISGISVAGVSVGTLALVVILSVFNGFDSVVQSLFSVFDPQLKITVAQGKTFDPGEAGFVAIRQLPEVAGYTEVLEGEALLSYNEHQYFATVKGVPDNYLETTGLDSAYISEGEFRLRSSDIPLAVVGQGVANSLSISINYTEPLHIYTLKQGSKSRLTMATAFYHSRILPSGVFIIQPEIDSKYILVPFDYASELFQTGKRISAAEIKLKPGVSDKDAKKKVQAILGDRFVVKTRYEQHELQFKVMKSEKWAIFLILGFILIVASFNILGSLSMLIIDKKDDIAILQSMGANQKLIRTIFLFEGWLISIIGAIIGLILGVLICWLQIRFGLLRLPGAEGAFVISAYPVEIQIPDLFAVFFTVLAIGFLAAWYPIRFISGKYLQGDFK